MLEEEPPVGRVPIVGTVAAGTPILAQECIEDYLAFDTGGRDGEYFALRVRGEPVSCRGIWWWYTSSRRPATERSSWR